MNVPRSGTHKKIILLCSIFFCSGLWLYPQSPDWLTKRKYSEEYFYGRGTGSTEEEAELSGKREVLLQLNSQIQSLVRLEVSNRAPEGEALEQLDVYFDSSQLRAAEVEERFQKGEEHYALVRYPEDCGLALTSSALKRYEKSLGIESEKIMEQLHGGAMVRAAVMGLILGDISNDDYGEDLAVRANGNEFSIQIFNFDAYDSDFTEGQRQGLGVLSKKIAEELQRFEIKKVSVEGHANPTGRQGEEDILQSLSLKRAETMAESLRLAGVKIDTVRGLGGSAVLGDLSSEEGKGLNRRVEVKIQFK